MHRKFFLTLCLLFVVTMIGWSQENATLPQYDEGLKRIFPEYAKLVKTEARGYAVQDAEGRELGRLLVEYSREGEKARGFNGPIELAVAFKDNKAIGVLIGANEETPRFLLRVTENALPDAWNGATLEEIAVREVKPVTGATYSSKAIIADVRRLALDHLKYHGAEPPAAPTTLSEECDDVTAVAETALQRLRAAASTAGRRPWAVASTAGSRPWAAVSTAGSRPWVAASTAGNRPWAAVSTAGSRPWAAASTAGNRPWAAEVSQPDTAVPEAPLPQEIPAE